MTTAAARAAHARLLCLDVDGTLTDGRLYLSGGKTARAFHVLDGHGVQRFIAAGNIAAIITAADDDETLRARAAQMGIKHLYTAAADKLAVLQSLLRAEELTAKQAAYVGDDVLDLPPMRHVGFACAPKTAAAEVRAAAHYIPERPAGAGAVREVCDFILSARAGA